MSRTQCSPCKFLKHSYQLYDSEADCPFLCYKLSLIKGFGEEKQQEEEKRRVSSLPTDTFVFLKSRSCFLTSTVHLFSLSPPNTCAHSIITQVWCLGPLNFLFMHPSIPRIAITFSPTLANRSFGSVNFSGWTAQQNRLLARTQQNKK